MTPADRARFRGRETAAQLKPKLILLFIELWFGFRGRETAAQLKHNTFLSTGESHEKIPRSRDCGSIEASEMLAAKFQSVADSAVERLRLN